MRTSLTRGAFVLVVPFCLFALTAGPRAAAKLGDLGKVGSVAFKTSCGAPVQQDFERAMALLHSFFYQEARRLFTEIAAKDPDCAMAHWGIAMSHYHPIWTAPDPTEMAAGLDAVEKALRAKKKDARETEFIRAIEAYYKGIESPAAAQPSGQSCHGPTSAAPQGKASCYLRELEKITTKNPDDVEAAAFYALQLVATATPGDPELSNQRKAAQILEKWYAKHPEHPGLAHYLIHSYDYPPVARKGLPAARAYATIAPVVPHALHMPSHIFTRLGMWKETIDSNLASAEAARQYAATYHPDAASFEELHALDYLIYGYLQTAQDRKAQEVLARLGQIKKTQPETDFVVAYASGAMPARHALERRAWKESVSLSRSSLPFWDKLPFAEGHLVYARAVGASFLKDVPTARAAAEKLGELSRSIKDPRFRYFADQTEIQRDAALGLIALAEGKKDEAVKLLRAAATREDTLGKHPVSPGALLPVRELLGEALLESGKPAEALKEYEASLAIYPRRLNGLYGAGLSAERAGEPGKARQYYAELVEMTTLGEATRPEVGKAREFLRGE